MIYLHQPPQDSSLHHFTTLNFPNSKKKKPSRDLRVVATLCQLTCVGCSVGVQQRLNSAGLPKLTEPCASSAASAVIIWAAGDRWWHLGNTLDAALHTNPTLTSPFPFPHYKVYQNCVFPSVLTACPRVETPSLFYISPFSQLFLSAFYYGNRYLSSSHNTILDSE